jgi:hypothetical protein
LKFVNPILNSTSTLRLKTAKTSFLFVFLISFTFAISFAQQIVGYSFDKYPATLYKGPKANLNLKSSPTAIRYRTQIKNQYRTSGIEFAGKYSMIFWGAGTGGLTLGAMVDNRTGIVYDLPLTVEFSNRGCWSSALNFDNNILYKENSRLFITWTCQEEINEATKTTTITKHYSFFLWNEAKKKFTLAKKFSRELPQAGAG